MPKFRARATPSSAAAPIAVAALIAAAALAGCASERLSSEPPPGERLAGDWKLDVARSDDLGKAVAQLRAQGAKARRGSGGGGLQPGSGGNGRHGRRGHSPGGQQGGQPGQDQSLQQPDTNAEEVGVGAGPHASPVDELMSNLPRGDYLRIKVSPNAFTVVSGDSANEYTPGLESEISAEDGDAQQISGWKGADYVIDTRPQWGAEILQRYTVTQDGRLMLTLRLTGARTKFTFTRMYDRTTRVAPLAPPTNN